MTVQGNLQQLNGDLELAKAQLKDLNFANELTDFGVAPKQTLEVNYGTNTPTAILGGGTVIFTKDLQQVIEQPATADHDRYAGRRSRHHNSFGAPDPVRRGHEGNFDDEIQHRLAVRLDNLTNGDHSLALIFFCEGAICWESYQRQPQGDTRRLYQGVLVSRRPGVVASCRLSHPDRAAGGARTGRQPDARGHDGAEAALGAGGIAERIGATPARRPGQFICRDHHRLCDVGVPRTQGVDRRDARQCRSVGGLHRGQRAAMGAAQGRERMDAAKTVSQAR